MTMTYSHVRFSQIGHVVEAAQEEVAVRGDEMSVLEALISGSEETSLPGASVSCQPGIEWLFPVQSRIPVQLRQSTRLGRLLSFVKWTINFYIGKTLGDDRSQLGPGVELDLKGSRDHIRSVSVIRREDGHIPVPDPQHEGERSEEFHSKVMEGLPSTTVF